jgi:hypothetical protein
MKLIKSFCGVQGRFSQKEPLVAEGKSNFMVAHHDASLARRRMKTMLSISSFYSRGLIYQARPGRFTHGFDESNPYNRIDVHFFFAPLRVSSRLIFMVDVQFIKSESLLPYYI